ncbi:MAG: PKD domain-containing protein [Labedaea sp.]
MPTDEGPRLRRSHYAILGAAGIVTATVFAVVASFASRPASHVQPVPDLPGPVIADSSTDQRPVIVTTTEATSAAVVPPPSTPATTTDKPTTSTVTTTTTKAVPPPKPGPKPPTATFAVTCRATACTFDGSGSTDPDGAIVYWAWSFGDDSGRNGQRLQQVTHNYQGPGTYAVVLVVMDNDGKIGQASSRITVTR